MEILVNASVAVALLLTVSASSSAQLSSPIDSCAGVAVQIAPPQPPGCFDGTPHKQTCVLVDKGVQLQVLDWGGADKADTMVLLAGLGNNAHVFDQFAYQFTDYFHVIGITRRGFLPSSQPKEGYDVDTRARDDIEVLKALGISKAVFVGHSVAGSELSKIALKYQGYVDKLVYLDANDVFFQGPALPPPPKEDDRSLQVFVASGVRLDNNLIPDQATCADLKFDAKGAITGSTTPDWVYTKIHAGIDEPTSSPTDWAKIKAPRLGIFGQRSVQGKLPYYWYLSSDEQRVFDANWPGIVQWYTDIFDKFERPNAGKPSPVVYLLPNAPHYFYISDQAFVVRVMREFLLGKMKL